MVCDRSDISHSDTEHERVETHLIKSITIRPRVHTNKLKVTATWRNDLVKRETGGDVTQLENNLKSSLIFKHREHQ